jgi:phosphoribosylformimino-5-aminoimidazole carboxamide ribonucleotide (ProFAR) isomerase
MNKLVLSLIAICCCLTIGAQTQQGVTLHGTIQSDMLLPQNDSEIGAEKTGDFLTNTYVDLQLQSQYVDAGVRNVLCTEISKDGTLAGPAIDLYKRVMDAYPELHLIASGGVSGKEDIDALDAAGIPAVVFGKAIYEGRIDLRQLKIEK